MGAPEGIAYNDNTKQLFVGDSHSNRVTIYNLANGITDGMNASYVLGQPDYTTKNNTVTQNGMGDSQEGLGIDTQRDILYQADDNYNRILVFDLANGITNDMNVSMVLDQANFTSSDYSCATASATNLCDPEGDIAVDSANNRIYVSDSSFNRILIYNFISLGANAQGTLNTPYSKAIPTVNAQGSTSFHIVSGSLPPGLSLNTATGIVSGTPTAVGSYTFDVSLTDDGGVIGSFTNDPPYTITIASASSNTTTPAAPSTGFGNPQASNWSKVKMVVVIPLSFTILGYLLVRHERQKAVQPK